MACVLWQNDWYVVRLSVCLPLCCDASVLWQTFCHIALKCQLPCFKITVYVGQQLVHFVPCCPVQLPYVKWSCWRDYLFKQINDDDDDDDDDDDVSVCVALVLLCSVHVSFCPGILVQWSARVSLCVGISVRVVILKHMRPPLTYMDRKLQSALSIIKLPLSV